jgi:signal recognition particle receptor subunit beta
MSLATEGDRTIFFDFMALDLGKISGMDVHFKLYTVPGQVRYNQTRKMVLKGADGVVFVADSQADMMPANLESLDDLFGNLAELGIDGETIPIIVQYNKRDLPNILALPELDAEINRRGYVSFAATAVTGEGVVETVKEACKQVLRRLTASLGAEPEARAPRAPTPTKGQATPATLAAPRSADTDTAAPRSVDSKGRAAEIADLVAGIDSLREAIPAKSGMEAMRKEVAELAKRVDRLADTSASTEVPRGAPSDAGSPAPCETMADLATRADVEALLEKTTELPGKADFNALHEKITGRASRADFEALQNKLEQLPDASRIEALLKKIAAAVPCDEAGAEAEARKIRTGTILSTRTPHPSHGS